MAQSGDALNPRLARQAKNEALVREVNERIQQFTTEAQDEGFRDNSMTFEFQCECGMGEGDYPGCEEPVEMTLQEYEDVRAQDDRFAVCPGHEMPELEDVVRRTEKYFVVDKRPSAEPLVADDPRGAPSS